MPLRGLFEQHYTAKHMQAKCRTGVAIQMNAIITLGYTPPSQWGDINTFFCAKEISASHMCKHFISETTGSQSNPAALEWTTQCKVKVKAKINNFKSLSCWLCNRKSRTKYNTSLFSTVQYWTVHELIYMPFIIYYLPILAFQTQLLVYACKACFDVAVSLIQDNFLQWETIKLP